MRAHSRLFRTAAALALAGSLAACANFAPPNTRPPLAAEPAYDPDLRPDGTVVASELSYHDWFPDPRLEALIATALANNRDLVAATARIAQARAQYRIQESRELPEVTLDASGQRIRQALAGNPAFGAIGQNQGDDGEAPNSITYETYRAGVGITSFELDFWGRLQNLSEAARAQYLSTIASQRAFYLSLVADVATTYFEMVETEAQVSLAQATTKSRQDGLRIARRRLDAGVTSALPYRQAETLLTQAEQQLANERLNLAQLRNQMTVLVGGRLPDGLPLGLPLTAQGDDRRLLAGLPSQLLLVRPDILAAEEQLRAARANIGAARAAFFPTISLTGDTGFTSGALDNLFDTDNIGWSFGPTISLPIFDAGAREAQLDNARAVEVEEVANYDRAVQTAFREVADGLAGRRYLAEQIETLARAVTAQETLARLARLRYREGVVDYLEVLDAERNLFDAQQQLITTRRLWLQNRANLFVALGGGFDIDQRAPQIPAGAVPPILPDRDNGAARPAPQPAQR